MLGILTKIQLHQYRKAWRERNPHNSTVAQSQFDFDSVKVGKKTYGDLSVYNYNRGQKLTIGSFCSIAGNVMFILNADHPTNTISSFPYHVFIAQDQEFEALSKGDIIVDDDVWIGYGATILSGVHIDQGAVIAAGAVVSKDVPPYAIVGGVPAKVIKYRFTSDIIEELLKIDYSQLNEKDIKEHINNFYSEIKTLDDAKRLTSWMPKKS
ncbi:CatB-related O-acetyltransferase [Lachnospiraceae bacterium YH-ros2226]